LYFQLPSKAQIKKPEGYDVACAPANFLEAHRAESKQSLVGWRWARRRTFSPMGKSSKEPYGREQTLRPAVGAGPASADSGLSISKNFVLGKPRVRAHDVSSTADRASTREMVAPSEFHGVEAARRRAPCPSGFVKDHTRRSTGADAQGESGRARLVRLPRGRETDRQAQGGRLSGARWRIWRRRSACGCSAARDSFAELCDRDASQMGRHSIREQSLVAYIGKRPRLRDAS